MRFCPYSGCLDRITAPLCATYSTRCCALAFQEKDPLGLPYIPPFAGEAGFAGDEPPRVANQRSGRGGCGVSPSIEGGMRPRSEAAGSRPQWVVFGPS
jgi:hypothetical protein